MLNTGRLTLPAATPVRPSSRSKCVDPAELLADQFARAASRRIDDVLRDKWSNDDDGKVLLSKSILQGEQTWLEQGTIGLPYGSEELRPETMEDDFAGRKRPAVESGPRPVVLPLPRTGTH